MEEKREKEGEKRGKRRNERSGVRETTSTRERSWQPSDEGTLTRERLLCHLTAPIIRCVHTVSINIMYYIIYIIYIIYIYISDNIDY